MILKLHILSRRAKKIEFPVNGSAEPCARGRVRRGEPIGEYEIWISVAGEYVVTKKV